MLTKLVWPARHSNMRWNFSWRCWYLSGKYSIPYLYVDSKRFFTFQKLSFSISIYFNKAGYNLTNGRWRLKEKYLVFHWVSWTCTITWYGEPNVTREVIKKLFWLFWVELFLLSARYHADQGGQWGLFNDTRHRFIFNLLGKKQCVICTKSPPQHHVKIAPSDNDNSFSLTHARCWLRMSRLRLAS